MASQASGCRVALLGPWPPPFGGVQTHLVALREGLRAAGAKTAVFNITRHRGVRTDDVFYPRGAAELIAQLWKYRPSVVHVHLGGDLTPRLLGLLAVCRTIFGPVLVVTMHSGGYPRSPRAAMLSRYSTEGFVFRQLAHVIVVNSELKDLFERIGVPSDHVTELIPTLRVPEPASTLPAGLEAFLAPADPVVVTVGLLEDEYLIPLQLEAFRKFSLTNENARFVIVGSGSREEVIRSTIAVMGLGDRVLLSGDTPHAVTIALMKRATMLWRITAYDGDSVSVREAIELGTPVIATDNRMRPKGTELVNASADDIAEHACAVAKRGPPERRTHYADSDRYRAVLDSHVRIVMRVAQQAGSGFGIHPQVNR
jgi:glycogen(starch) synthase